MTEHAFKTCSWLLFATIDAHCTVFLSLTKHSSSLIEVHSLVITTLLVLRTLKQADPAHHVGRGQASYFGSVARAEARGPKGRERDRVLGEGAASPSPPAVRSGECCKLPQRGPGQGLWFSCILEAPRGLSWNLLGLEFSLFSSDIGQRHSEFGFQVIYRLLEFPSVLP